MKKIFLFYAIAIFCSSCSIGGRDETSIVNKSDKDTLVVELFKSDFKPKHFEIRKNYISLLDEITYQTISVNHLRVLLRNSLDTSKTKNSSRYRHEINNLNNENLAEINYYTQDKINLKIYVMPLKSLAVGSTSFLFKPEIPFAWDSLLIHKSDGSKLKITNENFETFINEKTKDRGCGDCGIENNYNINIQ